MNRTIEGPDRFMIVVVGMALVVNLLSTYLSGYPKVVAVASYSLLAAIAVWMAFWGLRIVTGSVTAPMYAVETFILDSQNRLLLIYHPFHKKFVPPGGRIGRHEFPNEALCSRLEERIGLKTADFQFHPKIHQVVSKAVIGRAEKVCPPFIIQKEKTRQRRWVKYHYDFIYVLQLLNEHVAFKDNAYSPRWVSLPEMERIDADKESFPDVLDTYRVILDKVR